MSDEAAPAKKTGGKGKMILVILVLLIMGGAGIAGGLYAAGAFGSAEEEGPKEDPNKPQLVLKGEDPVAIAEKFTGAAGEGGGEAHAATPGKGFKLPRGGVDLPRPKDASKYQATYFQMPAPYTSNLADTDSLVQIALAVSTYYDGRVLDAVKTHEMAIRSEILMMLAQEQELNLATPQGKEALQKKLTKLINKTLKEKTGYSGVDNVYFTNFVIQ
jgi:flagellar protein FliL